jgi:phage head maturation protease
MDILIPGSLSRSLESDLVIRLRALHEHARNEGYPSTRGATIYGYDAEGNTLKKATV